MKKKIFVDHKYKSRHLDVSHQHLNLSLHVSALIFVSAVEEAVDGLLNPQKWFQQVVQQVDLVRKDLPCDRPLHLAQHLGHLRLKALQYFPHRFFFFPTDAPELPQPLLLQSLGKISGLNL